MSLTDMFASDKDTETHRVCGTCGKLRPVEDFYKDGKDNHGNIKYRRDCKECYKVTRIRESEMKRRKTK
jgi:hypothetical protein